MFRMTVADIFAIKNRGLVATGEIEEGEIGVGDTVTVRDRSVPVAAIEMFRKKRDRAGAGDTVGLLFKDLSREDIAPGDAITGAGMAPGSWEQEFPGGLPR